MRVDYLIPVAVLAALGLGACGGPASEPAAPSASAPAAPAPAAPAVPAPALADLPAPWNEANLAEGEAQFAKCRSCHSLKAKDGNLVGPNLHGLFDRKPASAKGFRYSEALKAKNFEAWTPEMIDEWLQKPANYVPGTAMFFNGIAKPEPRRNLIGYLMIESRK